MASRVLLILLILVSLQLVFAANPYSSLYGAKTSLHRTGIYYYWCQGECAFLMCNPVSVEPTAGYSFNLGGFHVRMVPVASNSSVSYKVFVDNVYCGNLVAPNGLLCPVASFSTAALSLVFYDYEPVSTDPRCSLMLRIANPEPNNVTIKLINKTKVPEPHNATIYVTLSKGYNSTHYLNISANLEYTLSFSQPTRCGEIRWTSKIVGYLRESRAMLVSKSCEQSYQLNVPQGEISKVTELLERAKGGSISYSELSQYSPKPVGEPTCRSSVKLLGSSQKRSVNISTTLKIRVAPGYVLFGNVIGGSSGNVYSCCKESSGSPGEVLDLLGSKINRSLVIENYTPIVAVVRGSGIQGARVLSLENLSRLLSELTSMAKLGKGSLSLELRPAPGYHVLNYSLVDPACGIAVLKVYIDTRTRDAEIAFAWNYSPSTCSYSGYRVCRFEFAPNQSPYPRVNVTLNRTVTKINISNFTVQDVVLGCLRVFYVRGHTLLITPEKQENKTINRLILTALGCSDYLHCCQGRASYGCVQRVQCPGSESCLEISGGLVRILLHGALGVEEIIGNVAGFNYTVVFANGQVTRCFSNAPKLKSVQQVSNTELAQLQAILKHQNDPDAITPVSIYIDRCAAVLIKNGTMAYRYFGSQGCPFSNLPTRSFVKHGATCSAYVSQNTNLGKAYVIDCEFLKILYNPSNLEVCTSSGGCQLSTANVSWVFLSSDNGYKVILHNESDDRGAGARGYVLQRQNFRSRGARLVGQGPGK